MMKKVVVVLGPTASGKTKLAIQLAKKYGGEIISADSMQVYRELNIVTAKPTKEEMEEIPHHYMDLIGLEEERSVADFVSYGKGCIERLHKEGKTPILVGGTGLYIDSLINGISFNESGINIEVKEKWEKVLKEKGKEYLHNCLLNIDPEIGKKVHVNNVVRVLRSLEICDTTGLSVEEYQRRGKRENPLFSPIYIGLYFGQREKLYERINQRVEEMMNRGLIEEAHQVYMTKKVSKTAYQAIGYKELFPYFKEEESLESCVEKIKQNTRRYAKRQLTWFRRNTDITWYDIEELGAEELRREVIKKIEREIKGTRE